MLLILPPSETKRDGGTAGSQLKLDTLGFDELRPQREQVIAALRHLSRSVTASTVALGLGPTQRFEIDRNRAVLTAPTMPAIERYTGVVYDAFDAARLDRTARSFAAQHLAVGSALFGLLRADDPIPAYRLSHDSRLEGLALGRHWRIAVAAQLEQVAGLILDLRSEAYAALGRIPVRDNALYIRVVAEAVGGGAGEGVGRRRVALSHFNKKAKGEFARAVAESGVVHESAASLLAWAAGNGIRLEPGAAGELDLVV